MSARTHWFDVVAIRGGFSDKVRRLVRWLKAMTDANPSATLPHQPVRHHGHLLLTRRGLTDGEAVQGVDGFAEAYYCTTCRDYYVLGWQLENAPLKERSVVVPQACLPDPASNLADLSVFCPKCRTQQSQYGRVLWPGQHRLEMVAREVFSFVFGGPGDTREASLHSPKFDGKPCDPVLLVSGDLPDEADRTNVLGSFLESQLQALQTKASPLDTETPLAVQVVWVDKVIDETAPLIALLSQTLDRGRNAAILWCMTYGVVRHEPSGGEIVLCLVNRGDG